MFFTGTAVEIGPVTNVDHRPVGAGAIGPVVTELRRLYTAATRGRLEAYAHWLLPVGQAHGLSSELTVCVS
jgi:branched-chain amino acid aminotransferase